QTEQRSAVIEANLTPPSPLKDFLETADANVARAMAVPPDLLQAPKRSKYGNRAVVIDGIRFQSRAEGAYYEELKLRRAAGELVPPYFLLQVPFRLPGNITYRVDFVEFPADGTVGFIDVKGVLTKTTLNKLKQVRALYDVTVRCVRKKGGGFVENDWTRQYR